MKVSVVGLRTIQIPSDCLLPFFDLLFQVVRVRVRLLDAMLFLCHILFGPDPVGSKEDFSKRVQKEDVMTVLVAGVYFVKLSNLETHSLILGWPFFLIFLIMTLVNKRRKSVNFKL